MKPLDDNLIVSGLSEDSGTVFEIGTVTAAHDAWEDGTPPKFQPGDRVRLGRAVGLAFADEKGQRSVLVSSVYVKPWGAREERKRDALRKKRAEGNSKAEARQ
jgi:hypothetical protein